MSIHTQGKLNAPNSVECLFSMTLQPGMVRSTNYTMLHIKVGTCKLKPVMKAPGPVRKPGAS